MQFKLKRQRAPEINVVSLQGITPERDSPLIFVTPTLLGEEKGILAKRAAVVLSCRLLSLIDRCAGRAGQHLQCWSSGLFPHPISGIVMLNQNAARHQGTLQPPHHSVRLASSLSLHGLHFVTGILSCDLLIMPFLFQQ
jgi:hypothetical protein